ncbi:putative magnetosome protein conserved in Magnetomorum sp. HK-1 [Candidatus Desulfarcum epimagneticum]|uniref:Putative magnetosome protein conserved in Magnetomorum sp. HK-1 n=1 Tax=uncultured Desulfobacteraceae bacterium TaxID=218296 RepID=A0A484HLF6_9BACT|nr:putative magnetosome protein conserved in Magnetomorum sp. HK-1 [uncultured Desulfobacteraceae bacterium]
MAELSQIKDKPYFSGEDVMADDAEAYSDAPARRVPIDAGRLTTNLILTVAIFVGLPVLWFYFSTSPENLKRLTFLTLPFFNLVYIFLLSAVTLIVSSFFLVPLKPFLTGPLFLLSLFCSFPLIIGLQHRLDFSQVVAGIEFFKDWPFFLRPAWILSHFLFPAGIIMFVFLYARALFSKKNAYVYLFSIILVSGAAFLSMSSIVRAGQPNLIALFQPETAPAPGNIQTPRDLDLADNLAGHPDGLSTSRTAAPMAMVSDARDSAPMDLSGALQQESPPPGMMGNLENKLKSLIGLIDQKISQMENQAGKEKTRQTKAIAAMETQIKIVSSRMEYISARLDAMETKWMESRDLNLKNSQVPEIAGEKQAPRGKGGKNEKKH